jgi:hypothetical protein
MAMDHHPCIELGSTDKYLSADTVVGQGAHRIVQELSELPDTKVAIVH